LKEIFQAIKSAVESISGDWYPKCIYVDFDQANIIALRSVFPLARILLCFFHLKQAIRKKAIKIFGGKLEARMVGLEFTRFWLKTKSLDTLNENLMVIFLFYFFILIFYFNF
jgi:hypothetical protein